MESYVNNRTKGSTVIGHRTFHALLQAFPPLPSDPQAATQSYAQLVFLVASFIALSVIIGIAFKARGTINAMISSANREVVKRLDSVVKSVDNLTSVVNHLNARDGITAAALESMQRNYDNLDRRVDEAVKKVSRLEGALSVRNT